MTEDFTQLCKRLEHFETPEWAARAILEKEQTGYLIVDPCCGSGVLAEVAARKDTTRVVAAFDIFDWGYRPMSPIIDYFPNNPSDFIRKCYFLPQYEQETDIFMNPPFSSACDFVERAIARGARKIICFQRFAWWESRKRRDFWRAHPPARVYICGDRADCWRHDIPPEKRKSGTPTAHAWFVWERGHEGDTTLHHIWKDGL